MKKIISLLLSALLAAGCASSLIGCSDNGNGSEEENSAPVSSNAENGTPEEEEETEWVDPFAGTDFGGRAFRVSTSIDENDATNADYLKKIFPQASVHLVPGTEHALPIFIPELIDEAVDSCLRLAAAGQDPT